MGGNVFKDSLGNSLTKRISKTDTFTTIKWLENTFSLSFINNLVGSTGKKDSTSDIDIAIDENIISKEILIQKINNWLQYNKFNPKDYIRKSGISVHFLCPVNGMVKKEYVQVDFMFCNDIEFMKESLSYNTNSIYGGASRNLFLSSLAKSTAGDYKYSWKQGLIHRSNGGIITKDMNEIAKFLLGDNHNKNDIESLETILNSIKSNKPIINNLSNLIKKLNDSNIKSDQEEAMRIKIILEKTI